MPTATKPLSAADRQKLTEEYVENDAMSTVLHVLIGNVGTGDSPYLQSTFGPPWCDLIVKETDPYVHEGDHNYISELWPDDENLDGTDYQVVSRRSDVLAAQLLAAIVANPDYLVRLAAWLLERVATHEQRAAA